MDKYGILEQKIVEVNDPTVNLEIMDNSFYSLRGKKKYSELSFKSDYTNTPLEVEEIVEFVEENIGVSFSPTEILSIAGFSKNNASLYRNKAEAILLSKNIKLEKIKKGMYTSALENK